jgi:hypothetical protein
VRGLLKAGTWNVRNLNQCRRFENLKLEMARMRINILGKSEMRWPEEGDFWSGDYRIIHTELNNGIDGVGLMMSKLLGLRVKIYLQYSERLIMMKVEKFPRDTVIVQVYVTTGTHYEE